MPDLHYQTYLIFSISILDQVDLSSSDKIISKTATMHHLLSLQNKNLHNFKLINIWDHPMTEITFFYAIQFAYRSLYQISLEKSNPNKWTT